MNRKDINPHFLFQLLSQIKGNTSPKTTIIFSLPPLYNFLYLKNQAQKESLKKLPMERNIQLFIKPKNRGLFMNKSWYLSFAVVTALTLALQANEEVTMLPVEEVELADEVAFEDHAVTTDEVAAEDAEVSCEAEEEVATEDSEVSCEVEEEVATEDAEVSCEAEEEVAAEDSEVSCEAEEEVAAEDAEVSCEVEEEVASQDEEVIADDDAEMERVFLEGDKTEEASKEA